ncbi:MAG TPA: hypothetical protein VFO63_04000 [Blastocatellia bacterium]|nr:hypothetical protein [Blastocatellia bacterium]
MNHEEMERAIEFLLEHHAKLSTDLDKLKELQAQTTSDIQALTANIARSEAQAEADRREMHESINSLKEEMREGFDKLILANEVTREFSENVARLAMATSQRVTTIESKLE